MPDIICVKDSVKMQKERSGLLIELPNDYVQHGDLFKCPKCKMEVLGDIGQAHPRRSTKIADVVLRRRDR